MDMIKIAGVGIITVFLCVLLKPHYKEYSLLVSITFGILVFAYAISQCGIIIQTMSDLFDRTNLDFEYFAVILKVIGISYICYFAVQMARDAGENTIAAQIEVAGKIIIFVLSIPILKSLIEILVKLING